MNVVTPASAETNARSFWHPSLWLPALFAFVLMALVVHVFGVGVPYNDDFNVPGHFLFRFVQGQLQWHDFWEQNVDSRLLFPKLIWLLEACTTGWSTKHWMYGGLFLVFGELILANALLRAAGAATPVLWTFSIFAALLLLHPWNAPGSFLRGSQAVIVLPSLLLLLGCYLHLGRLSFQSKLLLYVLFSTLGTFSFANGMLLWALLFPVWPLRHELVQGVSSRRRLVRPLSLVVLIGTIVVTAYFYGFHRAPNPGWDGNLWHFLQFFSRWLGASLASQWDPALSLHFGLALVILGLGLTIFLVVVSYRHGTARYFKLTWPWLTLLSYTTISGLLTTWGRQGMGFATALHPRYFMTTLLFPLALIGLAASCLAFSSKAQPLIYRVSSTILLTGLGFAILFLLLGWPPGWQASFRYGKAMQRRALALQLWRHAPDIYPLPLNSAKPPPEWRTRYFTLLDADILPDPGNGDWFPSALAHASERPFVGEFSVFSQGNKSWVSGWAVHPSSHLPFAAAILTQEDANRTQRVVNVTLMTLPAPKNSTDHFNTSRPLSAFRFEPLQGSISAPVDARHVRVFAVNFVTHELFPLALKP